MRKKIIIGLILVFVLISIYYFYFFDNKNIPICGNAVCDDYNEVHSCLQDCTCIPEGKYPAVDQRPCCENLVHITEACNPEKEICPVGSSGYCTSHCGNGICEKDKENTYFESDYNCPVDCPSL